MRRSFQTRIKRIILLALAFVLWFAALAHGAHDVWASSVVFLCLSLIAMAVTTTCLAKSGTIKLPLIFPVSVFLTVLWFSSLFSYDVNSSRLELWGWFFVSIEFYLLINMFETDADKTFFFTSAGIVTIPLSLFALWQQAKGTADPWGHWEIHSTLVNSNVLAGFGLVWVVFFGLQGIPRAKRLVLILSGVLILLLARSWWAYLSLLFAITLSERDRLKQLAYSFPRKTLLAVAVTTAVVVLAVTYKLRVHTGPYDGVGRLSYWRAALSMGAAHPLLGVGPGAFGSAYPFFRRGGLQNTLFAHSFLFQLFAETGFLGTLSLAFFVLGFFQHTRQRAMQGDFRSPFGPMLAALICFSLLNINMNYLVHKLLLMAILAALMDSPSNHTFRVNALRIVALDVSLVLLVPLWISLFLASRWFTQGLWYEERGDISRSLSAFQNAVRIDSSQADSYRHLAQLYWNRHLHSDGVDDRAQAITSMETAFRLKRDPSTLKLLSQWRQTQ